MRVPLFQLKHAPVVTTAGEQLGYLKEVILDAETRVVTQIVAQEHRLWGEERLIAGSQIYSFEVDKVLVHDTAIVDDESSSAGDIRPQPVAMRDAVLRSE